MNLGPKFRLWFVGLSFVLALPPMADPALARDAAFIDPGANSGANAEDAIRVEPKNEIDLGDSTLGVARRTTLFFVNQSPAQIQIEKVEINNDSNVTGEAVNDDCTKQGTLASGSRCTIEMSITPNTPGPWSTEILMTHSGAGRITRAKITGKSGSAANDKKETGLLLSTKDVKPIDFGTVEAGNGKIVRSALMINDSPDPITLYAIDVIEADNNLQRLDQGCAVDMELKPGESCPVTLVWTPAEKGLISTDLIIRHSGRLGFAVIPIRGEAKDLSEAANTKGSGNGRAAKSETTRAVSLLPPPSAQDLEKAIPKIAPVAISTLSGENSAATGSLHLIGTVGNRAVLLKPDGTTAIAMSGDMIDLGDNHTAKLISVSAKSAEILIGGKKKQFVLEAVQELMERARIAKQDAAASSAPSNPPPKPRSDQTASSSTPLLPTPAQSLSPYGNLSK